MSLNSRFQLTTIASRRVAAETRVVERTCATSDLRMTSTGFLTLEHAILFY